MQNSIFGGCLCGQIQFEAKEPTNIHSCSCAICQKHTGSQAAVWIEFQAANVKWIGEGGKPAIYRSSDYSSRAFCSQCGSSIGAIDDAPTVALLTGIINKSSDMEIILESHSFADEAPCWWRRYFSYNTLSKD
ncbi:hypothetical protein M2263_000334 [Providencia alcalifaciens]|nr:hypothetical protein [Providencia alcalifaciens]